jgi:hypothetical protein
MTEPSGQLSVVSSSLDLGSGVTSDVLVLSAANRAKRSQGCSFPKRIRKDTNQEVHHLAAQGCECCHGRLPYSSVRVT